MAEESEVSSASSTQTDEEPTIDKGNTANTETVAVAEEEEKKKEEEGCSEVTVVDNEIVIPRSTQELAIAVDAAAAVAPSEPSLYEQYDARKILKGAAGGALVLLGCALVPLPLPVGVPVIMSGMKVLGSEFAAAKRAEDTLTETAHTAKLRLQKTVHTQFGTTPRSKAFGKYDLDVTIQRFFRQHHQNNSKNAGDGPQPRCVKFLPYELTMGQFTNSLTTITFYHQGDYRTIQHQLTHRLEAILTVNPWLTGFLAVQPTPNKEDSTAAVSTAASPVTAGAAAAGARTPKTSNTIRDTTESDLKLWYYDDPNLLQRGKNMNDSTAHNNNNADNDDTNNNDDSRRRRSTSRNNSIIPPNMWTCYEPGEIPFQRSTKYAEYQEWLPRHVTVPSLAGLIGKSTEPVWKISLIPDASAPFTRFAIVVSLSHLIGDAHTYYKLYHLLFQNPTTTTTTKRTTEGNHNHTASTTCNTNTPPRRQTTGGIINTGPVETLNPERRPDIQYHIDKHMGPKEANYIHKTRENMADQWYKGLMKENVSTNYDKKETMLFTVSNEWLKKKMEECITKKIEDDQQSTPIQNDQKNRSNPSITTSNLTAVSSMEANTRSSSGTSVSTLTLEGEDVNELHPTDMLLSWWMNTSGADIGMIPHHLRNKLTVLSECDAGNYSTPIPYTKDDFRTPHQIKESIKRGKRYTASHSNTYETTSKLPEITTGYTFALGIDWEQHVSKRYWKANKDDTKIVSSINGDDTNNNNNDNDDDNDNIEEDFHVPYFTERDIAVMPPRMNSCLFFTAKNGRDVVDEDTTSTSSSNNRSSRSSSSNNKTKEETTRIGVFIHATRAICLKITDCGIIDDEPTSSKSAEITASPNGGVSGRRSSLIQFKDLDRLTKEFGDSIRLELNNDMDLELGDEDGDDTDNADYNEGKKEEIKFKK